MFESEIKIVGKNKIKRIPDFKKSDGDVKVGKIFIYYPDEIEKILKYKSKYKTLRGDYETLQKRIKSLEESISQKDDNIKQLLTDNDNLNEEKDELNTTITSIRIQYDEHLEELDGKYDDMTSKYNDSVDMIHSLISTTSLLRGDIENMGFFKRTFRFRDNVNQLFEERNLNGLIEQHLIHKDSQIPEKTLKKD